jgi:two-component system LytT family response regulator
MNSYLNIASANSGPTNLESMDMDTNLNSLSVVPRNASSLANKLRVMSPDVAASRFSTRIAIRAKRKILLINPADVIAVEAQGNYVLVRQTSSSHLLRESISTMEEKLAPHGFVRIHRSVLVNRACVEEIRPWSTGEYVLRARDKEYTVTRTYRKNLRLLAQLWIGGASAVAG